MKKFIKLIACFIFVVSGQLATAMKNPEYIKQLTFQIGKDTVLQFPSPHGSISVVFEDDGETGYFYALDNANQDQPIQEAMNIYNVRGNPAKGKMATIKIRWSSDGNSAGIWLNDLPQAIFDFRKQRGYCLTNFPKPGKWTAHDFKWDDSALALFK